MATKLEQQKDIENALETLEGVASEIEDGALLVVTIKSTSKSNLSFAFDVRLYAKNSDGKIVSWYLNWAYAVLMGMRQNQRGEVKGSGIGIDRAFEVANNLEWLIEKHLNKTLKVAYQGVF